MTSVSSENVYLLQSSNKSDLEHCLNLQQSGFQDVFNGLISLKWLFPDGLVDAPLPSEDLARRSSGLEALGMPAIPLFCKRRCGGAGGRSQV